VRNSEVIEAIEAIEAMDPMRLLAARTLTWALLFGGWLVLGTLGQLRLPLWAGGLAPVALWLGTAGLVRCGRSISLSAAWLRAIVVLAGLATAAALAGAAEGGGVLAIAAASIGWGVLLVAASRTVQMARAATRRPPSPVVPAAAGAALAWMVAGDPATGSSVAAALWPAAIALPALLLAALVPGHGTRKGGRPGLFDCTSMAAGWAPWRDPATWAVQSARWAMLPMMASLAVTSQWCGSAWGLSPSQASGLHLGAMLLPPLVLHLSRVRLPNAMGVGLAMAAGLVMLCALPGLQGLMAASMCHSLAWGLASFAQVDAPPVSRSPNLPLGVLRAVAPACCVWVLGLAIADSGPWALWWVHFTLGALATVGSVVGLCRPAFFRMERKP